MKIGMFYFQNKMYTKVGDLEFENGKLKTIKYSDLWLKEGFSFNGLPLQKEILYENNPEFLLTRLMSTSNRYYKKRCEQMKISPDATFEEKLVTIGWNTDGAIHLIPLNFTTSIWESNPTLNNLKERLFYL